MLVNILFNRTVFERLVGTLGVVAAISFQEFDCMNSFQLRPLLEESWMNLAMMWGMRWPQAPTAMKTALEASEAEVVARERR
jgi:hypothetical protein